RDVPDVVDLGRPAEDRAAVVLADLGDPEVGGHHVALGEHAGELSPVGDPDTLHAVLVRAAEDHLTVGVDVGGEEVEGRDRGLGGDVRHVLGRGAVGADQALDVGLTQGGEGGHRPVVGNGDRVVEGPVGRLRVDVVR